MSAKKTAVKKPVKPGTPKSKAPVKRAAVKKPAAKPAPTDGEG